MKKIAIFLDHDIIIRHFINSEIFSDLQKKYKIFYIFPKNHRRVKYELKSLNIKNFYEIPINEERAYTIRMFYHACNVRNLQIKKNSLDEQIRYKKILGRKLFYLYKYFLNNSLIFKLFKIIKKFQIKENSFIDSFLKKENIDLIIHPTVLEGLFVYDLIESGKRLSIPTFYLMNSWDNPSTKALMDGSPDKLFVWGEQTKLHANKYLNIPIKNLVISGAAQMQIYKKDIKNLIENYRNTINVSLEDKILCYAGSSRGLNETKQLIILDKYIKQKNLKNIKIVYKPHPWKSFDKNSEETNFENYTFKNIIMDPFSKKNYDLRLKGSDKINLDLISYENTNQMLRSIDALFTPLSTIMLEATMMGIPVCVYYPQDKSEFKKSFTYDLGREMFLEYFEKVKPIISLNEDDILSCFDNLLDKMDDKNYKKELKFNSLFFNESMNIDYKKILNDNVEKSFS